MSTVGQDFIFGFINNYDGSGLLVALVSNANDQPANVTVTSTFASFQTINVLVQPYTIEKVKCFRVRYYNVLQILITPLTIAARYNDQVGSTTLVTENKGIRIQSTLPVAVYAHSEIADGTR